MVVSSPGHKLGQMIGDFFEDMFTKPLLLFAKENGHYCDLKGLRPAVRESKKKVSWVDKEGNKHDMDIVIEKNGSDKVQGSPAAFIELAWRRYTKHSRNKAGEIQGSLLHLRDTYECCTFIGAIISGEWTEGAIEQMRSNEIEVLYIPFSVIAECFMKKDVDLNYPEDAPDTEKEILIKKLECLSKNDVDDVEKCIKSKIEKEYTVFMKKLEGCIQRRLEYVLIIPLFGDSLEFSNVADAIKYVTTFTEEKAERPFHKYEVYIKFGNGDHVNGSFEEKTNLIQFLKVFL